MGNQFLNYHTCSMLVFLEYPTAQMDYVKNKINSPPSIFNKFRSLKINCYKINIFMSKTKLIHRRYKGLRQFFINFKSLKISCNKINIFIQCKYYTKNQQQNNRNYRIKEHYNVS